MPKQIWEYMGASVIGPAHLINGMPNQDAWIAKRFKWGNVIAVADGLGSKRYSDIGAKAACNAIVDAAKWFQKRANRNHEELSRAIHRNWLNRLGSLESTDCATTCLFAIQIGQSITLGRLGDGMLIAVDGNHEHEVILSDDKGESFSNFTLCLGREFRPEHWELATLDSNSYNAVLICSDGIADDLVVEQRGSFAHEFYQAYSTQSHSERSLDLLRWLNNWPVPGHTDDKTVACLVKRGPRFE